MSRNVAIGVGAAFGVVCAAAAALLGRSRWLRVGRELRAEYPSAYEAGTLSEWLVLRRFFGCLWAEERAWRKAAAGRGGGGGGSARRIARVSPASRDALEGALFGVVPRSELTGAVSMRMEAKAEHLRHLRGPGSLPPMGSPLDRVLEPESVGTAAAAVHGRRLLPRIMDVDAAAHDGGGGDEAKRAPQSALPTPVHRGPPVGVDVDRGAGSRAAGDGGAGGGVVAIGGGKSAIVSAAAAAFEPRVLRLEDYGN